MCLRIKKVLDYRQRKKGGQIKEMELNIAIIEDEKPAADLLKSYIDRYSREKSVECRVKWYDNPINFIESYDGKLDIILLDIEFPIANGMDIARKLRQTDKNVVLIFVTNMAQYAIVGYEVDASGYIVKPVSYSDFAMKFERAIKKLYSVQYQKIAVVRGDSRLFVLVRDVRYIEVMRHTIIYHTLHGDYETYGTLKKVEATLPEEVFARCNNYCLVNLDYVYSINGYTLLISRGHNDSGVDEMSVSHPRKKEFLKTLGKYIGANN